jgi:hypothetical protein
MSSIFRRIVPLLLPWSLAIVSGAAHAAVVLKFSGGELSGASGVVVNGAVYDVEFRDGTCDSVFNGCNASTFAFTSLAAADAASQALLDFVFKDSSAGAFDTDPKRILGCGEDLDDNDCRAFTPYEVDIVNPPTDVSYSIATNLEGVGGFIATGGGKSTSNRSTSGDSGGTAVWAVWTRVQAVPEPGTLALVGVAALALAGLRRRQRGV